MHGVEGEAPSSVPPVGVSILASWLSIPLSVFFFLYFVLILKIPFSLFLNYIRLLPLCLIFSLFFLSLFSFLLLPLRRFFIKGKGCALLIDISPALANLNSKAYISTSLGNLHNRYKPFLINSKYSLLGYVIFLLQASILAVQGLILVSGQRGGLNKTIVARKVFYGKQRWSKPRLMNNRRW